MIALVTPEGDERVFEGVCRGSIQSEARGHNGFGYDPIFVPAAAETTFAEMEAGDKHRISHRGRALSAFRRAFADMARSPDDGGGARER